MASYDEIQDATSRAWRSFESMLMLELGEDLDSKTFWNIADSSICRVNDYVMQATDFGVECPSCGSELDNEDEINSDGTCCYCEE